MICRSWEGKRIWSTLVYVFPYLLIKDMVLMKVTSLGEVNSCAHGERNQSIESKGKAHILLTNWLMQGRGKWKNSLCRRTCKWIY